MSGDSFRHAFALVALPDAATPSERGGGGQPCANVNEEGGRLTEVRQAGQGAAWADDWLRQIYGQCVARSHCGNEFGIAWRYWVPEDKRNQKGRGVCLCKRFTDQRR